MALPNAVVSIVVKSLDGLPAATPGPGNTRYARATFQGGKLPGVNTGRTRPIPDAGGSFDLTTEASPWVYEALLDPGEEISISIDLLEDHGDAPPPAAVNFIGKISDPWKPGARTLGPGPTFSVEVVRRMVNPTDKAFLARAAKADGKSGALAVPQGYYVEITSIDGLYKPDLAATIPQPGSKKVAGYLSEDNRGRIFTNRKPDGTWTNDTQYVDVQVKVTAFGGLTIPGGVMVRWQISDVDDPTNDEPDFHREWGPYVDANDYDAAGKPLGAKPGDNASAFSPGNADEDKLFGAGVGGNARWAQIPGGPAPSAISRIAAKSPIAQSDPKTGTSSVRIHCTNVLGTNMILGVALEGVPPAKPVFAARTGVMTMWSRIQAEVVKMKSAHSLAGALPDIPKFFLPACVQMDFELERSVDTVVRAGVPVNLDIKELSPDDDHESEKSADWVRNPEVFQHAGKGGWFFVGAACFASPLPPPGAPRPPLFTDTKYTLGLDASGPFVQIKGNFPTAKFARFVWKDGGLDQIAGFNVYKVKRAGTDSKLYLVPNDVSPLFTGHDSDGSLDHAYLSQMQFYPQHQVDAGSSSFDPGGFGVPAAGASLTVRGPGATFTSGISPSQPDAVLGTGEFFAGRTIIFTHVPKFSTGTPPAPVLDFTQKVLSTVVHEFTHAFGMPHKCGYWNWRTPRQGGAERSCCMNYFNTWLLNVPAKKLLPNTVNKQGDDMCGRHLMEVRRVHLEKNKGLGW